MADYPPPHDLRHTFVTRLLDLGVPIEALDAAGKTSSAEALAAARWKQTE